MVHCVVFGCSARQENCPGRSFHTFPKDKKIRKAWINRINRRDFTPSSSSTVCSYHFMELDFERKKKSDRPTKFQKRRLKPNAIPSSNLRGEGKDTRIVKRRTLNYINAGKDVGLVKTFAESQNATRQEDESYSSEVDQATVSSERECEIQPTDLETGSGDMASSSTQNLMTECQAAKKALRLLESRVLSVPKMSEQEVRSFTGLDKGIFHHIADYIGRFQPLNYWTGKTVTKLSTPDQLLIFILKLKFDLPNFLLAKLFNLSMTTIRNIFMTFLHAMHELFYQKYLNKLPSIEKHQITCPESFNDIQNCRLVIDCTEFLVETPRKDLDAAATLFSNYKKRLTFKYLIGVAPNGSITFISNGYPGSTSDKMVTNECGVLSHLQAGDLVLADKGFMIHDMMPSGVVLNMPPFLSGKDQFTEEEARFCKKIATCRIHVERAIERLRNFKILNLLTCKRRHYAGRGKLLSARLQAIGMACMTCSLRFGRYMLNLPHKYIYNCTK